jgi:hypothetical protein
MMLSCQPSYQHSGAFVNKSTSTYTETPYATIYWWQVLCKPKILPIKSAHMERLEQIMKAATEAAQGEEKE